METGRAEGNGLDLGVHLKMFGERDHLAIRVEELSRNDSRGAWTVVCRARSVRRGGVSMGDGIGVRCQPGF